ncbi:MAG: M23 family metallopeptidase [Xanthobacteraceae bacterium]
MTRVRFPSPAPILLSIGVVLASAAAAAAFELGLPVACDLGRTCFVQNYVDHDASTGARDYACGALTYDGHDGTDFRLPTRRAGVPVIAAADGVVLRMRDGVAEGALQTGGREAVRGRECGNGVLIDHGGGFQTQYCHMARGSLRVRPKQQVGAGDRLGDVGMSGLTEFQHLHITVRRDGKVVDPFAVDAAAGSCGGGTSLWKASVREALRYRPGSVINAGFASKPVTMAMVERGETFSIGADAPAIVAFVRAIGLKGGDVQRLVVHAPGGAVLADSTAAPLDRDKAQALQFAGKKARSPWPRGTYRAHYTVTRKGKVVLEHRFELTF